MSDLVIIAINLEASRINGIVELHGVVKIGKKVKNEVTGKWESLVTNTVRTVNPGELCCSYEWAGRMVEMKFTESEVKRLLLDARTDNPELEKRKDKNRPFDYYSMQAAIDGHVYQVIADRTPTDKGESKKWRLLVNPRAAILPLGAAPFEEW